MNVGRLKNWLHYYVSAYEILINQNSLVDVKSSNTESSIYTSKFCGSTGIGKDA